MPTALENATGIYMTGIRDGRPADVRPFIGERYTQHSTGVPDGPEGFLSFFEEFLARTPERDIQVVRSWQDGRHVFMQVFQSLNGGEAQWVTTDFFDSDEQGRIIEHWDVISAYTGHTPSGHTEIDGATEITDLHQTEANKALVREMIETCLMRGTTGQRIDEFISADTYIQHNASVPDGLEHFRPLAQDPNRPLNYDEIVLLVGSGNFVATLCRADWQGTEYAQVDVFRVQDGKIVEHWDNAEPVLDNPVNSGKF
ncbi:MAG: nuclear transport factor 2 family protein [Myxococcales bacterium]|nr:nuclear transport factor 2 family protein [Myxococcales bacterium]